MEHEIVNRETPEMSCFISGVQEVSKRIREIAQTHRPLFKGEIYLTDGMSANNSSLVPIPCKIIGTRALFPIPKSQGRYSTSSPTWRSFWKKTISKDLFRSSLFVYMLARHVIYKLLFHKNGIWGYVIKDYAEAYIIIKITKTFFLNELTI